MPSTEESQWFSEHVEQHEPALRAYLSRRFPSLPDHDDLVQETYSRALRAWQLGHLTHARGFLFTAARNIAIDLIRRRRKHEPEADEKMLPLLDENPGVRDAIDQEQRHKILIEAMAALPPRCREVMMCRYNDGLSYKEIGDRLGLSPETVKVHLIKGVRDCTRHFHRRGILEDGKVIRLAS